MLKIQDMKDFFSSAVESPQTLLAKTSQAIASSAFALAAAQAAKKVIVVSAQTLVEFTSVGAENPIFGRIANINTVIRLGPLSGRVLELAVLGILCYSASVISLKYARKFCHVESERTPVVHTPGKGKFIT